MPMALWHMMPCDWAAFGAVSRLTKTFPETFNPKHMSIVNANVKTPVLPKVRGGGSIPGTPIEEGKAVKAAPATTRTAALVGARKEPSTHASMARWWG